MDYFPQNPNPKSNQLLKSPLTSPPQNPLLDVLAMDMDITTTTAPAPATTTPSTIKTPESDTETPSRVQPTKPLSFTNGLLKRHHSIHHHHNNPPPIVLIYKECLKNHAASLGGHALDGCGEFMPSPSATRTDPTSLKCAACGCHRNFHRREPEDPLPPPPNSAVMEYQPHHRHRPPPPRGGSPSSPSPPPISSSYPASAPHMLLALSAGLPGAQPENNPTVGHATAPIAPHTNGRKRFRTKFTQNQKDKMYEFSERVGWKIQKRDEAAIAEFCSEIGVDRGVLKVWMHNNKSTFGKRDNIVNTNGGTTYNNDTNHANNGGSGSRENTGQLQDQHHHHHLHHNNDNVSPSDHVVVTNGSGSSSSS